MQECINFRVPPHPSPHGGYLSSFWGRRGGKVREGKKEEQGEGKERKGPEGRENRRFKGGTT